MAVWSGLPTSAGSNNALNHNGSAGDSTNYQYVDDTLGSHDSDTTYIGKTAGGFTDDTYNFNNDSSYNGKTINSVTVYGYFRRVNTSRGVVKSFIALLSGNYSYAASGTVSETSYTLYSGVFSEKPGGGSWTSTDVDNAEFGIHLSANALTEHRCTQIYIVVDYTDISAPGTPGLITPADNATVWTTRPNLIVTSVSSGGGTVTYQYQVDTVTGFSSPDAQISGVASGVAVGTGWQVDTDLTPGTQYYWRCRANNGTADSNWSTTSGFTVGTFPAPTGLRCDFDSSLIVEANGYPNFAATFIGSGSGGAAEYAQVIIMTGTNAANYLSPLIDTGWVDISTTNSGSISSVVVYSGYLSSYINNAVSGYYWNIRFKNASGIYSSWGDASSASYITGYVVPYALTRSGMSYGDEANFPPVVFSGNDPYGSIPWENVVAIQAHLSVRLADEAFEPPTSGFNANFEIQVMSGQHQSPGTINWNTAGSEQNVNIFYKNGNQWQSLIASGAVNPSLLSCQSGITYAIHFYDADYLWASGYDRYDIEARVDRIDFLCSGHKAFYMNKKSWSTIDQDERIELSFGTDHATIPSGYTASMQLDTGAAKVVAENLILEAMPDAFCNVVYANGKTHCVYIGDYEDTSSGYTIYIVSKDHVTNTWGDPYLIDGAYTGTDTHHGPALCVDNDGYLHVFYGTHGANTTEGLKYKRSVSKNKSGSGDDGTWTTVSSIAYPVTYPVPLVNNSGHIYVVFRTQLSGTSPGTEPNLGYIYSTNNGTSWSNIKYFAYNPSSGRTYMHGTYFDKKANRFHASISFIDSTNRSLGVWYAYTDDFITWKNISGNTCGTTSDSYNATTLMSGSAPNTPSLVAASDEKRSVFGRPIIIDNDNRPHIFMTADQSRVPYYVGYFGQDQAIYYPGSLWHSYWDGANWTTTEISNEIDVGVWASNYSIKPLIDQDDNIVVYINEKPLREYTIQASASGTYSNFTASVSPTYSAINYHRDIYSTDNYIVLSGGSSGITTYSGNFSLIPTGYINSVAVESIVQKDGPLNNEERNLYFYSVLRVNGVLYSGVTHHYRDVYDGTAYANSGYTELPYIFKWYLNPATGSGWTRSDLDNIEFGISKPVLSGILRIYDLQCRVDVINNTHPHQFAGEVVALVSRDNGSTWTKEYITNYSQRGVPQLSIKNDFSNNQLEMIWSAGNKLYYYNIDKTNHFNNDGSDVRLYYGTEEIDRIADRWNNDTTNIEFRIQENIASGAAYGPKDYYLYFLDRNASYAKDNPKNVYRFYESFEDYPALQWFPTIKRYRNNITKSTFSYSTNDDNNYDATYDAKDEFGQIACSGVIVEIFSYTPTLADVGPSYSVRISNSGTWASGLVVATGAGSADFLSSVSGCFINYIVVTGVSTTGTSVKVDYGAVTAGLPADAPKVSGFINSISYITQVSGWTPKSGYFSMRDAPPVQPAWVFAGGKTLVAATNFASIEKTIGTGLNNVYVEFAINALRGAGGPTKRAVYLTNATQQFGLGINLNTIELGSYKKGCVYYCSGTTDVDTNYSGLYDQSWHRFKILVRNGLCDAWWGNYQVCTGINALSGGIDKILISGAEGSSTYEGDCYDYIKVYDYLETVPIVSTGIVERKCINFLAAIQSKETLLLGFNYVISGVFSDVRQQIWPEFFMQVAGSQQIPSSNLEINDYDAKILAEYQGFTVANSNISLDVGKLFNNDAIISAEYIGEKEFYSKYNIAVNKDFVLDSQLYYCGTKALELDQKIPIEFGSIISYLCNIGAGYLSDIEAHAKFFHEYTSEVIAFAKIINGYLVGRLFDYTLSVDNVKLLESDLKICGAWINNLACDNIITAEYLEIKHLYAQLVNEYCRMLNNDNCIIPSWLQDIVSDHQIMIDHLSSVISIDNKENFEHGIVCGNSLVLPIDYLKQIETDTNISINWLGGVSLNLDINVPVDFIGTVSFDNVNPIDYLANKEFLHNVWFDFTGNVIIDTKISTDYLKTIDGFYNFYNESTKTVVNNFNILNEYLSTHSNYVSNIPAEYLKLLDSDINISTDNTGTAVLNLDLNIPISFTAILDNFGNLSLDAGKSLIFDNVINTEYTKLIDSLYHNIPIDFLATAGFIINSINVPTDWLSNINNDTNIGNAYLSDAVFNFDNRVYIDYGTSFSSIFKMPIDAQLSFNAFISIIRDWLNTVDGRVEIVFDNISNIRAGVNFRFDFGRNVIASSRIPLERLIRILSDKNIPIWERSALIEAFLFKNINVLSPALSGINVSSPELRAVLISGIGLGISLSGPDVIEENVASPSISGHNFIGQSN